MRKHKRHLLRKAYPAPTPNCATRYYCYMNCQHFMSKKTCRVIYGRR